MNREIGKKAKALWLLAAMSAPVAQCSAMCNWRYVLMVGGLAVLVQIAASGWIRPFGKILTAGYLFTMILLLGETVKLAVMNWPGGNVWYLAFVMLAVAALGARRGVATNCRSGTVIFWITVVIAGIIAVTGVKDIHIKWLMQNGTASNGLLLAVLLLPTMAEIIPEQEKMNGLLVTGIAAIYALVIALLVDGTLSPQVVAMEENPLYVYSKSLSLFGVAKRFEAIVAIGLTLGYYALSTLLLTMAVRLVKGNKDRGARAERAVIVTAMAGAMLMIGIKGLQESLVWGITAVFGGIIPICIKTIQFEKKMRKTVKRC